MSNATPAVVDQEPCVWMIITVEDLILSWDNDMLFIQKKTNMIKWLKFLKYATCVSNPSIFTMFVNCEFNPDLNEIFTKSLEIALKNLRKILWHYLKSFKSYIVSSFSGKDFLTYSVNGFIRVYDGTTYLVLFGPEKYDAIYSRIRYLRSVNSICYFSQLCKIKICSYDSKPI